MTRVLVTGATGFIGRHLVRALLQQGEEVAGLLRPDGDERFFTELGIEIVRGDLHQGEFPESRFAGIDVVYHLAGVTNGRSRADFEGPNVAGTRRVLEACASQTSPPTVIYVSSLAAAGPAARDHPLSESDPAQPVSAYGRSKRCAELLVAEFADRLPVSIVRPPMVFGPDDRTIGPLLENIRRWRFCPLPGYRHRRQYSFCYVEDLAFALVEVAHRANRVDPDDATAPGFREGCYFVAYDEYITFADFATRITSTLGKKFALRLPIPDTIMAIAGRVNDWRSRNQPRLEDLSHDKVRDLNAGSWTCNTAKIQGELGFQPALPFNERLQETIDHWLEGSQRANGKLREMPA